MQKPFKNRKNNSLLSFLLAVIMVFSISTHSAFASSITNEKPKPNETGIKINTTVDIITFNDFHGSLAEETGPKGQNIGMSKMVGYVKNAVLKNPNTIVVSGGDNYQGTAMSNLTYGAPVSTMMKSMNVVASAVGNHEFDWGVNYIEKWSEDGGFDFLAANIYDTKTGKTVEWAKPYKIVEKGGLKIAFLGLAHPDTVTLTKEQYVTGLEFRDPVKTAETWVNFLKSGKANEGTPDIIIALTHIDSYQNKDTKEITGKAVELAKVEGLDAIISAHSHLPVVGKINGKPIIQSYKNGRNMGILSIELDENKKVKTIEPKLDSVNKIKDSIVSDTEAVKAYKEYEDKFKPILNEIIGTATDDFTHDKTLDNVSSLGRWVCEVLQNKTDAEVAIQNGGGLRRTLSKGNITIGDMYEIMPFDNSLITMDVKGCDLKQAIDHGILNPEVVDGQFSGLIVEFDKNAPFENRITKISLPDGTPLDMNKYYKVVISDFMQTGGDKYNFKNAKNVVNTFIPIRDVLVEAIKEAKTITPKAVDYIKEAEKIETVPTEVTTSDNTSTILDTYTVKVNDVLWKIAKKYNTTWQRLSEFNNLSNPHLIFPGQNILIPAN